MIKHAPNYDQHHDNIRVGFSAGFSLGYVKGCCPLEKESYEEPFMTLIQWSLFKSDFKGEQKIRKHLQTLLKIAIQDFLRVKH